MKNFIVEIVNAMTEEAVRSLSFATIGYAEEYCVRYNKDSDNVMIAVVRATEAKSQTPFQRVADMNTAFGNVKGDADSIDWGKVRSQCKNILDEYLELVDALGLNNENVKSQGFYAKPDVEAVRDALCDIQVFSQGAQHMMGYNGDNDMHDVVDGVMSRFIKDEADKDATIKLHAAKGVAEVYFEGDFPKMVMKSAVDQPDAPIHKFLKSNSYKNTKFRPAP